MSGQADVEDDGVEAVERRRELDPGPAVGRVLDDVAILLEEAGQAAGEAFVVLDEKQVHRPEIVRRQAPTPDVALAMSAGGVVDRDREAEALGAAARDGRVDADHRARGVEQRAAAVAGVDRGVGLEQVVEGRRAAGLLVLDGHVAAESRTGSRG